MSARRRFPADVLTWVTCPKCWFKYTVDADPDRRCPMCTKDKEKGGA